MVVVQKFGGTSVLGLERIKSSANIVKQNILKGNKVVVVVSAMAGETDRLINLYKEAISNTIEDDYLLAEMDSIVSTGEQTCAGLFACMLNSIGIKARSFTGISAGIITDSTYTKAKIKGIMFDEVFKAMEAGITPVITGFQGFCPETLRQTTLGRGGSDTSALAISAFLKADKCEIYKDVKGVLTGDPTISTNISKIDALSYDSMLEIASSGSKVLEIKSVNFGAKYGVKLEVKSSFEDEKGTEIKTTINEKVNIQNISFSQKDALVKIKLKDLEFFDSSKVSFTILHIDEKQRADILIPRAEVTKLKEKFKPQNVVQISIIGVFLKSDKILQRALKIIKDRGVCLVSTLSLETKITFFLKPKDEKTMNELYNKLHDEFIKPPLY